MWQEHFCKGLLYRLVYSRETRRREVKPAEKKRSRSIGIKLAANVK
jgi:hypothetical protein